MRGEAVNLVEAAEALVLEERAEDAVPLRAGLAQDGTRGRLRRGDTLVFFPLLSSFPTNPPPLIFIFE